MKIITLLFGFFVLYNHALAAEPTLIRIGVQATGTLAWELSVLQSDPQFKSVDFRIESHELANAEAGKIALQSGSVDMIVSDWIWVSRMRSEDAGFTFYPYSTTSGSLTVPANSVIKSIKDLPGKRLGIAGGELDKNWLLLQALGNQEKLDLNAKVEKVFAAPPLIDEQLKQGRVDAALNYWHFGAKLEAQGFRQLLNGNDIIRGLGIQETLPAIGYVFKQSWGEQHKMSLAAFIKAAAKVKDVLCESDPAWQKILPLTQTTDAGSQKILRQRYCEGRVKQWGKAEQNATAKIYTLLRKVSDGRLTGQSEQLQTGTFWALE